MSRRRPQAPEPKKQKFRVYMVPCSCGTTFPVADDYDQHGGQLSRYLTCPDCGKRHDPRNRVLELGYQQEGYWKVNKC